MSPFDLKTKRAVLKQNYLTMDKNSELVVTCSHEDGSGVVNNTCLFDVISGEEKMVNPDELA